MRRLPSMRRLWQMSVNDCHFTLEWQRQNLSDELEGLNTGYIQPSNGATRAGLLRSCRRRMSHLKHVADKLGVELAA